MQCSVGAGRLPVEGDDEQPEVEDAPPALRRPREEGSRELRKELYEWGEAFSPALPDQFDKLTL
jgi:hypothetical protein